MRPETYIQKALEGDYGDATRTDAEAALTDATNHGYDNDAERVAETLDAIRGGRS